MSGDGPWALLEIIETYRDLTDRHRNYYAHDLAFGATSAVSVVR